MPPIPPRFPEETLSLINSAERRYKHLSEVEVPALRQCIGPLSLQQSLAEEVRETTLLLARQIEELNLMVDDLPGEKNRTELRRIVTELQEKLESLRRDTRAALLTSKRAIDSRSKSNRDELLSAASALQEKDQQTSSEKTAEDALMQANADVTDALRRTIALMQAELERSVLSSQLLDTSTSALKAGSLQHDSLTGVMSTSKQLIIALEKSDWLDRMLILSAFSFFILVVLFIVKQRIVDKSLRIAFWWTKFIPSFSDDEDLLREAEKGMASAVTEVSTVAATIVSSVAAAFSTILASPPSSLASSILPTETLLPNATEAESTEATSPLSESISLEVEGSSIPADPTPSEPLIHVEL